MGLQWLFEQFAGKCHYCTRPMTLERHQPNSITRDHAIPKSRGGHGVRNNVVAACWRCNNVKSDMTAREFIAMWGGRWHELPEARPGQFYNDGKRYRRRVMRIITLADQKAVTLAEVWPKESP
jgi:CRISPR/Cas system Type II protein with McrA/HNH and RuvC-like nuclease domain